MNPQDKKMLKYIVADVLETDERARNDDKWLVWVVLRRWGIGIYIPFEQFKNMPSFESISRYRRKLQEGGRYQQRAETNDKRIMAEDEMRQINKWF